MNRSSTQNSQVINDCNEKHHASTHKCCYIFEPINNVDQPCKAAGSLRLSLNSHRSILKRPSMDLFNSSSAIPVSKRRGSYGQSLVVTKAGNYCMLVNNGGISTSISSLNDGVQQSIWCVSLSADIQCPWTSCSHLPKQLVGATYIVSQLNQSYTFTLN